jgi:hypothetical protein
MNRPAMPDLVERLRKIVETGDAVLAMADDAAILAEAATEISRLRALLAEIERRVPTRPARR